MGVTVETVTGLCSHGCVSGDELVILERELTSVAEDAKVLVHVARADGRSFDALATYEIGKSQPQSRVPILAFPAVHRNEIPDGTLISVRRADDG